MILLFFGPMLSYFILMLYAGVMTSILGREWLMLQDNVLTEYVIILQIYYFVCILLAVGPKRHS